MAVKNYNPADVAMFFGAIELVGLVDGTFINVVRNTDSFTLRVGADGEAARSKSNDRSAVITVTLMQSSIANNLLSAQLILDEATANAIVPFIIKDNSTNGTTLFSCETSWLQKAPDMAFGQEIETREWVFETDSMNVFIGGN
jgi:hypothetical protein